MLVRPLVERADLVLELLLIPTEIVSDGLDLGGARLDARQVGHEGVELRAAGEVRAPVHELIDRGVVLLHGEEVIPTGHRAPSSHS